MPPKQTLAKPLYISHRAHMHTVYLAFTHSILHTVSSSHTVYCIQYIVYLRPCIQYSISPSSHTVYYSTHTIYLSIQRYARFVKARGHSIIKHLGLALLANL